MRIINKKSTTTLALTMAVVVSIGFSHPAKADYQHDDYHHDDYHHDREWREHEWHARHWYGGYYAPAPRVVYAPPPVVYAPEPSPGINLIVPLHFR